MQMLSSLTPYIFVDIYIYIYSKHIYRILYYENISNGYLLLRPIFFSSSCIRFSNTGTVWDFSSRSCTWFKLDDNSSRVVFNSKTRLRLKRETNWENVLHCWILTFTKENSFKKIFLQSWQMMSLYLVCLRKMRQWRRLYIKIFF